MEPLTTPDAVIDALGGTTKASRLFGQKVATVHNWRMRKRIPPEHFLMVNVALAAIGKTADPDVFGMTVTEQAS
jgi:hypothetical protein